ncbi:MAG: TPM domain-containing protein [Bacillus sp. (in: Bacteria)]|nr:TPM domain-containing protein [Bacillus sp. (in: firmicutes)]MCM1426941.1 TPM domain-containing protein [Eubacterium sp.]
MKEYFRYFKWVYLSLIIITAVLFLIKGLHSLSAKTGYYDRTNAQCTAQRVFDYGGVLTDKEERKLTELIDKRQKQTQCDIVLVTLNESLKEYARSLEPNVSYAEFVRVYAEQFYETGGFGYDKPNGDGVILVDNWYREDNGRIYTWLCTTGIVQDTYSDADIDHILDRIYRYVETNPYRAYKTYINDFYDDMTGLRLLHMDIPKGLPVILGILAALVFIPLNWKSGSGKDTTTAVTYVEGGREQFTNRQDIFLRKSVVKRRIQTSSGGGHGGGHSGGGGGGGSHGGGGHSR